MAPSPSALLALATGYRRSKVLFAFLELDLATRLAAGSQPAERIAAAVGADPLAARRFLEVCVGLGLLVRDARGYANAPDVQRYLVRGAATDLGDLFGRHERASCSTAWARFAGRLRSWRSGVHGAMSTVGVPVGPEWDGQYRLALLAGDALGEALDLRGRTRLLDLGGGTAGMSIALCRRDLALRAIVLELPAMVPVARDYVGRSG